jgi:hypothetical protein
MNTGVKEKTVSVKSSQAIFPYVEKSTEIRYSYVTTLENSNKYADVAQLVEHVIGNDEVSSSILLIGSKVLLCKH